MKSSFRFSWKLRSLQSAILYVNTLPERGEQLCENQSSICKVMAVCLMICGKEIRRISTFSDKEISIKIDGRGD